MYELTVIIGRGTIIVGTLRGWHLFMEEEFGDGGGGCMFLVSSKISVIYCDNFNKFSLRFFIDMSSLLTGEIHNTENIFLTENLTSIFCLKVSRNTSHDNSRCFNLSSKYRFYLYCNLRR